MKITVSGEKKEYQDGLNVSQLLELEKVEMPLYVTVSINEEFVDRDDFDKTILKDGDEVELLYFMGGGC
jgi:sulfur carrier protein